MSHTQRCIKLGDSGGILNLGIVQAATSGMKVDAPQSSIREQQLSELFGLFDLDGSGVVEVAELLLLAKEKRVGSELVWTEQKNQQLMYRIDTDGSGGLDLPEFTTYFMDQWHGGMFKLSQLQFDETIVRFTDIGTTCRASFEQRVDLNSVGADPAELQHAGASGEAAEETVGGGKSGRARRASKDEAARTAAAGEEAASEEESASHSRRSREGESRRRSLSATQTPLQRRQQRGAERAWGRWTDQG